MSLEQGYVWVDHRPESNDPYKNFAKIRTTKPKPEPPVEPAIEQPVEPEPTIALVPTEEENNA
jgi:hypothetical protein